MNKELYEKASTEYAAADYRGALMDFTACLQDGDFPLDSGEMGLLYHKVGNCLIKLRNPIEAIQSYTLALNDEDYEGKGTLECNLGMAYASLHDYEDALTHFEAAVKDESCESPYKAYMGMGNALLKIGNNAEAGRAFREAALDDENPDPAGSLLNLGVCFMALNRPEDAVTTYNNAMEFDMRSDTRNKLYASLGQAYVASDQMEPAIEAFEKALEDKTYLLSDSASVDYQRAVDVLSRGGAERTQVIDAVDMSGLDISADGSTYDEVAYAEAPQDPFFYDEGPDEEETPPGYAVAAYEEDDERFFNATEGEIEQWATDLARQDRKRRSVGLKALLVVIIVLIVAFLCLLFVYVQGYGYPSQEDVVEQLFTDPEAASSTVFAPTVSEASKSTMLGEVVQDENAVIEGMDCSASESTVYVTATMPEGGQVTYQVTLVRDFIGWKISGIDFYIPSRE